MLSRALSLATATLLIGCLTAVAVRAVENLEAGKSPAQIFAGTCNACHKSPRGLLRSVPPYSLPGFLRQHYTTSSDMASVLASYLVANGATDTRSQGKEAKQGKDGAKEGTKEGRQEARAPADQGAKQQPRLPLQRAGETPDLMRPDLPAQATIDKGKKEKGKKGRPEEPARTEPATEPPKETAKETAKSDDSAKPAAEPKTESAKVEPRESPNEPVTTRPDPAPGVTPAPSTTAAAPAASSPVPAATSSSGESSSTPPVQALETPSAPAGEQSKPAIEPKPPAVAAAPAPPPVPPAGPPTVPISQ
jgi:hypothetical protein